MLDITKPRVWFDKPNTSTITVIETGIFKKLAARYRPQTHEEQVGYINVTPTTSYYWYVEAEEPIELKDVLFWIIMTVNPNE